MANNPKSKIYAILLRQVDRVGEFKDQPKIGFTAKRFKDYYELSNREREQVNYDLQKDPLLEIQFDRQAFGEIPRVKSATIKDVSAFISREKGSSLNDEIATALSDLNNIESDGEWWRRAQVEIREKWLENKTAYKVKRDQVNDLRDAVKLVDYIMEDNAVIPDMRTLSASLFADSKRIEGGQVSNIARRLMEADMDADLRASIKDARSFLEHYGIEKFPKEIRIQGPVTILGSNAGLTDISALSSGAGISPDDINTIQIHEKNVDYVLTIENKATFERYVREIRDNGVVLYTGGFPTRQWVRKVRDMMRCVHHKPAFYHWGDRDVGGYTILAYLARALDVDVQPWLMGPRTQSDMGLASQDTRNKSDLLKALSLSCSFGGIAKLYSEIEKMKESDLPWLEQENVSPKSPLTH